MDKSKETDKKNISLFECLSDIADPRIDRTRNHKLIDILTIGVCCLICGGEGFSDMETFGKAQHKWLQGFLELPNGIPSHDTFNRVFSAIDPAQFMECFVLWTKSLRHRISSEIIAIDGKALRRAYNKDNSIPYVVSAWASKQGLTLGQVKVDEKSNEITAIPKLLQILDIAGCIVTIDAMGCQKSIARDITNAGANYLLALKGNQGKTEEAVSAFFNELIPPDPSLPPPPDLNQTDYFQTVDGGHGRVETRRYWISDAINWFPKKDKWQGLKSFAMVESVREVGEKRSYERRYFLASIEPDANQFALACRGHWGIENPLHWVMDVTFGEDNSRARTKNAAENLATLRRLALNMLKTETSQKKLSIRSRKLMAAWNNDFLLKILGI